MSDDLTARLEAMLRTPAPVWSCAATRSGREQGPEPQAARRLGGSSRAGRWEVGWGCEMIARTAAPDYVRALREVWLQEI